MKQFRCDECGRFISLKDLEDGKATRRLLWPDTPFNDETFETLCRDHVDEPDTRTTLPSGNKLA